MKRLLKFAVIGLLLSVGFAAQADDTSSVRTKHYNLGKRSLALQGYDPVSYHVSGPKKGVSRWQHSHKGVTYQFSSAANLKKFQENPEKYEPAFGGWCAYAMLDGDKVKIDPKSYKIVSGKNYLFYDGVFGDTLKKWNALAKKQAESGLSAKAEKGWTKAKGEK